MRNPEVVEDDPGKYSVIRIKSPRLFIEKSIWSITLLEYLTIYIKDTWAIWEFGQKIE